MVPWTSYISKRYLLTHNGKRGHLGNILAILGLSIGIMTLVTVLTVMNGFQQGFITNINEIYSYHIRINMDGGDPPRLNNKGIRSSVPFKDQQGIITTDLALSSGGQLRFLDFNSAQGDSQFFNILNIVEGNSPKNSDDIILGIDLARYLNIQTGDMIQFSFLSLKSSSFENRRFKVSGLFRSGYYEYNRNMAFALFSETFDEPYVIGVKLENHFKDNSVMKELYRQYPDYNIVSWRTYNSAFFNALKIEKIFMFLIVALIFIVVSVNIYHSMKRNVKERLNELALLKAIGGTPPDIVRIYTFQGLLISIISTLSGTLLGILLCFNVNGIISFFLHFQMIFYEWTVRLTGADLRPPGQFYFMEIPIKFLWQDLIIINLTAFITVFIAAYSSINKASKILPAEIFRNE